MLKDKRFYKIYKNFFFNDKIAFPVFKRHIVFQKLGNIHRDFLINVETNVYDEKLKKSIMESEIHLMNSVIGFAQRTFAFAICSQCMRKILI